MTSARNSTQMWSEWKGNLDGTMELGQLISEMLQNPPRVADDVTQLFNLSLMMSQLERLFTNQLNAQSVPLNYNTYY